MHTGMSICAVKEIILNAAADGIVCYNKVESDFYRKDGLERMPLFSEYLRELMRTKQMTVSELARLAGTERTQLSRTLTGQRMLPYNTLDELVFHLKLTPSEEKLLRRYYDAQFEKEGIRRSREMIDSLFDDLVCLDFSIPAFAETRLLMSLDEYSGGRSVFNGETNVQLLLRMVVSEEMAREGARLELTVPPSDTFLTGELMHRYLDNKTTVEISQIICFDAASTGTDINLHNLECLCRILPICLLSGQHYHPSYYYDSHIATRYTDPFPYFLVTHSCVVCLSEEGTSAMLLRSADVVSYYRRHFRELRDKCHNLIHYTSDPLEILSSYQRCTEEDGFYMVMDQPCFGRFYVDDFISTHLRKGLPGYEQIYLAATERFDHLQKVSHFYTFFSESGLKRFMEDGTLDDFPVELVEPFPPEERGSLMKKLAAAIRSGDVTGRILQEGAFPNYLAICTSPNRGIGFFTTSQFPFSDGLCSVQIEEPNLCRAFHGWLTHLPDSNRAMTAQETADIMESLVD